MEQKYLYSIFISQVTKTWDLLTNYIAQTKRHVSSSATRKDTHMHTHMHF